MRRGFYESDLIVISAFIIETSKDSSPFCSSTLHHVRMQQRAALQAPILAPWSWTLQGLLGRCSTTWATLQSLSLTPDHRCMELSSSHKTHLKPVKTWLPGLILSSILCLYLAFKKDSQVILKVINTAWRERESTGTRPRYVHDIQIIRLWF
jgi:hypothetical protein